MGTAASAPDQRPPGLASQLPLQDDLLARLARVFETLNDGITVQHAAGRLLYANDAAARACGFQTGQELVEASVDKVLSRFRILDENGDPLSYEDLPGRTALAGEPSSEVLVQYLILETGERRWAEIKATPVFDDAGEVLYAINVVHDITELKRAEDELRKARDELEERVEARTRELKLVQRLIDQTNDAIFVVEPDSGRFAYVNEAACRELGYSQEELLEMRVQDIEAQIPTQTAWETFAENLRQAKQAMMEGAHRDAQGQLHPVEVNARYVEDQEEAYIVAVVRDLTQRKQAEEELERSNEELQQFAYVVSHDLQEPLRMVESYVSLLARRYQDQLDEDADTFIHYAVDGARRMRQLIKDLLTYSRVGTHGDPFEPTDLGDVLDRVIADLQLSIQEEGATIRYQGLPTVVADGSQMGQLFQNLVSNAVKFHRPQVPPEVEITAEETEEGWVISVQDNGIGIPQDQQEQLFHVFSRLHTHEEYEGTGIGLAVSRRVVDRHGGRIWLESTPGEGTTFHVLLPHREQEDLAGDPSFAHRQRRSAK